MNANHLCVRFGRYQCRVRFGRYVAPERPAMELIADDGTPVAIATVNLPDEDLGDDEIAIKNHSENAGVLAALVASGIVAEPHRFVRRGYVEIPVCRLLVPAVQAAT